MARVVGVAAADGVAAHLDGRRTVRDRLRAAIGVAATEEMTGSVSLEFAPAS
jgi:hypothetical protein